jgi:hypothetical protein
MTWDRRLYFPSEGRRATDFGRVNTHLNTYMHPYIQACVLTYIHIQYKYIHTYTTYIHTFSVYSECLLKMLSVRVVWCKVPKDWTLQVLATCVYNFSFHKFQRTKLQLPSTSVTFQELFGPRRTWKSGPCSCHFHVIICKYNIRNKISFKILLQCITTDTNTIQLKYKCR